MRELGTALSVPTEMINAMRREFYGENKGENNTRNRAVYEEKPNIPKEKFTQ